MTVTGTGAIHPTGVAVAKLQVLVSATDRFADMLKIEGRIQIICKYSSLKYFYPFYDF
jgi:hypothetical protein